MHQRTLITAQKAIAAFREEVGYRRVTGGTLPNTNAIVVAVKPPAPDAGAAPPPGSNGHGSARAGAQLADHSPPLALLIVPDEGEDPVPLPHEFDAGCDNREVLRWDAVAPDDDGTPPEWYVRLLVQGLLANIPDAPRASNEDDHQHPEQLSEQSEASPDEAGDSPPHHAVHSLDEHTGGVADGKTADGEQNHPPESHPGPRLTAGTTAPRAKDRPRETGSDEVETFTRDRQPASRAAPRPENPAVTVEPPETVVVLPDPEAATAGIPAGVPTGELSVPSVHDTEAQFPRQHAESATPPAAARDDNATQTPQASRDRQGPPADTHIAEIPAEEPARHTGGAEAAPEGRSHPSEEDSAELSEPPAPNDLSEAETAKQPEPPVSNDLPEAQTAELGQAPLLAADSETPLEGGDSAQSPVADAGSLDGLREGLLPDAFETEYGSPGGLLGEDGYPTWLAEMSEGRTHTPEQRLYLIRSREADTLKNRLLRRRAPEPPPRWASFAQLPVAMIELLRSSLQGAGVVTTANNKGGTGKSTVAVNLAFTLAMMGGASRGERMARVLLLDQNLSNPDLAYRVSVEGKPGRGMKNLLAGDGLERAVSRTVLHNLDVLFLLGRGDHDKRELEELMGDEGRMQAVYERLAGTDGYDVLVVDTGNCLPGEDKPEASALTLWASVADVNYLVLEPEPASFKNAAWFASELRDQLGEGIACVPVLNAFPERRIYESTPITRAMADRQRKTLRAMEHLHRLVGRPLDSRGRSLGEPLTIPDYSDEVKGFGAEGRAIVLASQLFASAYQRVAVDTARRMVANRREHAG